MIRASSPSPCSPTTPTPTADPSPSAPSPILPTAQSPSPAPPACNAPAPPTAVPSTSTVAGGAPAAVSLTVRCNIPPVAVDDAATVLEDAPATAIAVLANDTDVDGGPIAIASVTQGTSGTVVITGGGTGLTYAPDADFCGSDSFTYTLAPGGDSGNV